MSRALTILMLLAGSAGPLGAREAMTTEPRSGVVFPTEITTASGDGSHALAGVGIRTKTVFNVKVYAFGIYVDPAGAGTALGEYAGTPVGDLQKDPGFYDRILQMAFPMTLRIVMTRRVEGDAMAEAFDSALRPRVRRAAAEMSLPGGEEALERFRGFFGVEAMADRAELLFTCAGGTLATSIQGKPKAPIVSPALCWALFDVYLGEDPISVGGKRTVIMNVPEILGGESAVGRSRP